jgi:UDP:flavonoid glycosyltransferase YjiC (YdhE family)
MYALFTAIPLIGHLNPLLRQAEELQRRGWRVAFAGASEVRRHVESDAPGVPFIDLGPIGEIANAIRSDMEAASLDPNFVRGSVRVSNGLERVWPSMYEGLSRVIRADRPDVIVVDLFSSAGLTAADVAGVAAVVNNPDLLALLPVTMLPPADHLPFLFSGTSIHNIPWHQRFTAPLARRLAAIFMARVTQRRHNALRRRVGLGATTIHALLRNRRTLVNGVFGLEYERTLPEWVSMTGPMLQENLPPLPPDMDRWLSEGPPVVYAHLGTLAVAPPGQLQKMAEAFESERYRCLWILKDPSRLSKPLPESVRAMEWGPSPLSLLKHPNVKVFVSHCGINSVYESIAAGVPIVGIPMFADQRDMAARVMDAGVGLWLEKTGFSARELQNAIVRVLREPSFSANIPRIQSAIQKAGGVRRAADLIEQVAVSCQGRTA